MKIVALDSSTSALCVAVCDGQKEYEYRVDYSTRLSRCLVPALEQIFKTAGIAPSSVDFFACGIGPGSFTGIRIGMACVKGLAWAVSKPVAGVSSLDMLALNAGSENTMIASVIDARRGFVYAAFYSARKNGITRVSPYLLVSPQGLVKEMDKRRAGKKNELVFCGDGIPVIKECVALNGGVRFLDADYWKPQPRHLMELAKDCIRRKGTTGAQSVKPLYLYPKECQIRQTT